jgi:hypothetical protein
MEYIYKLCYILSSLLISVSYERLAEQMALDMTINLSSRALLPLYFKWTWLLLHIEELPAKRTAIPSEVLCSSVQSFQGSASIVYKIMPKPLPSNLPSIQCYTILATDSIIK